MRFVMKQKWMSFGDDFMIQNESGHDTYRVDGKAFSIGDQLAFQDLNGNELAYIAQRVLSWGKTYEISRRGEIVAVVKKALFSPIHHRFTVDVPGPNDLEATGNFTDHEYIFRRGDQTVASVSKQWFSWSDTYGIDIVPDEDPVLILASAVVIDMACHPDDGERH